MSMKEPFANTVQRARSCALLPLTRLPSLAVEQSPASVQLDSYRELWAS